MTQYKDYLTAINPLSTLTNMYPSETKNTSSPNLDILNKKIHIYTDLVAVS